MVVIFREGLNGKVRLLVSFELSKHCTFEEDVLSRFASVSLVAPTHFDLCLNVYMFEGSDRYVVKRGQHMQAMICN